MNEIISNRRSMEDVKAGSAKGINRNKLWENFELTVLALPTILILLVWNYFPMAGLVLAFKDYQYDYGIFGSKWNDLKNFTFSFLPWMHGGLHEILWDMAWFLLLSGLFRRSRLHCCSMK